MSRAVFAAFLRPPGRAQPPPPVRFRGSPAAAVAAAGTGDSEGHEGQRARAPSTSGSSAPSGAQPYALGLFRAFLDFGINFNPRMDFNCRLK